MQLAQLRWVQCRFDWGLTFALVKKAQLIPLEIPALMDGAKSSAALGSCGTSDCLPGFEVLWLYDVFGET
ncbi:hypothetical protein [Massilia frigida]|uniref:hypothetical protein n=1 Tax=Massilia frigida TaxID=2609281 RepID=UPI00141EB309|nr:hypothetical protein [Massilia frigida]